MIQEPDSGKDVNGRAPISRSLYDVRGPSHPQRALVTVLCFGWLVMAWWLLMAGGAAEVAHSLGWRGGAGDPGRRYAMAAALTVYFLRLLLTQFVFLKRAIAWSEAWTVGVWLGCIFAVLALGAGVHARPLGEAGLAGIALFLLGSWMNSWAEHQRERWKRQPEHMGQLYTGGLYRLCRHPNYLGDVISFSGLALVAGPWFAGAIPALMMGMFIFANVPMLDRHLEEHYGEPFREYARRTPRLVPFVY